MAFNRTGNRNVIIKRDTLRQLVKAVQELEKRGYEPIAPYKKTYFQCKRFDERTAVLNGLNRVKRHKFVECVEQVQYVIHMKKVE